MKKIMIIGSGGAGKSTLAKELGRKLGIPVHHLDTLFFGSRAVPTDREEFQQIQNSILAEDCWIIDGNFSGTMGDRLEKADTIIFLHYSTLRCLYGIIRRRIQYHGKSRPDNGEGCPERLEWAFVKWVAEFNRKKRRNC
jgi:adenylate kinase family enzyme